MLRKRGHDSSVSQPATKRAKVSFDFLSNPALENAAHSLPLLRFQPVNNLFMIFNNRNHLLTSITRYSQAVKDFQFNNNFFLSDSKNRYFITAENKILFDEVMTLISMAYTGIPLYHRLWIEMKNNHNETTHYRFYYFHSQSVINVIKYVKSRFKLILNTSTCPDFIMNTNERYFDIPSNFFQQVQNVLQQSNQAFKVATMDELHSLIKKHGHRMALSEKVFSNSEGRNPVVEVSVSSYSTVFPPETFLNLEEIKSALFQKDFYKISTLVKTSNDVKMLFNSLAVDNIKNLLRLILLSKNHQWIKYVDVGITVLQNNQRFPILEWYLHGMAIHRDLNFHHDLLLFLESALPDTSKVTYFTNVFNANVIARDSLIKLFFSEKSPQVDENIAPILNKIAENLRINCVEHVQDTTTQLTNFFNTAATQRALSVLPNTTPLLLDDSEQQLRMRQIDEREIDLNMKQLVLEGKEQELAIKELEFQESKKLLYSELEGYVASQLGKAFNALLDVTKVVTPESSIYFLHALKDILAGNPISATPVLSSTAGTFFQSQTNQVSETSSTSTSSYTSAAPGFSFSRSPDASS